MRNGAADGVCAVSLLGCLVDPDAMLAQCARALAPGGCLVATCSNRSSWVRRLRGRFPGRERARALTRGTFRMYTEREMQERLGSAGFQTLGCTYYSVPGFLGRWPVARGR